MRNPGRFLVKVYFFSKSGPRLEISYETVSEVSYILEATDGF